jgi:hypothetical protein
MKKIYILVVIFLASVFGLNAQIITIGTGTSASTGSDNGNPIYRSSGTSSFGWAISGHLYTSSQLSLIPAGSTITTVAFKKTSAFGTATGKSGILKIYMQNSTASTIAATLTRGTVQGYTNVYTNATQTVPATVGFISYTLSTPIVYTGGSLEVYMDWDIGSQASSGISTGAFLWEFSTGNTGQTGGTSNSAQLTTSSILASQPANRSYNVQFTITPPACTGAPSGVAATSNSASVCSGATANLDVTGTTIGYSGLTYQWQSSPAGANSFTNISGATTKAYTTTGIMANTDYRCTVTCTAGGSPVTSTPITVNVFSFPTITTISTPTTYYLGNSVTLSLTGLPIGPSYSYQWQSNINGAGFTNISATASTYAVLITAVPTTYQCIVTTCSPAISATSTVFTPNPLTGLCLASSTSQASWISSFNTTGGTTNILHSAALGASGGYLDLSSSNIVSNFSGQSTNFSMSSGGPTVGNAIWIDWNNNNYFETTERVFNTTSYITTSTGVISIPSGTAIGNYKMRVVTDYNNNNPSNPCLLIAQGEYKDFTFAVVAPPSCAPPLALTNSSVTLTSANHSWTAPAVAPSTGYEWSVTTSSTPPSTGTATTLLTASSSSLTAYTNYYLHVRSSCGASFSNWATSTFFTGYCIVSTTSQASWISAFTTTGGVSNISHTAASGAAGGYIDLSATILASNPVGVATNFSITNGGPTVGNAIWIDWNKNLTFETSEKVFATTSYITTSTGSIAIPSGTAIGNYKMRVVTDYNNSAPSNPCLVVGQGEYKDFTFAVVAPPSCLPPTALSTSMVTSTSAILSWKARVPAPSNGYEWIVGTSSTPPTGGASTADTFAIVSGFMPNTTYYFHVRSNCGAVDGLSAWATSSFKTLIANDLCVDAIDITSLIGINLADTVGKVTIVTAGSQGTLPRPSCTGTAATGQTKDVWYKFTASNVTDSTKIIGLSTEDWIAQLFDGCGSTVALACSDDDNVNGPYLRLCGLTNGQVYYIRMMPYGASTNTKMWIFKGGACPAPPNNDNCTGARNISTDCSMPNMGTFQNSSPSTVANLNCGGSSSFATQSDVWYKFKNGSSSVSQKISVKNIPTGKTYYGALYTGTCTNLIPVYCFFAQAGDSMVTNFILMRDSTYYVRIWENAVPTATSTFSICITDSTSALTIDSSSLNVCSGGYIQTINNAVNNTYGFNPLFDGITGRLVAEIDAQGNNLGDIGVNYYKNTGALRLDALGTPYLDRNINISVQNQPTTPVKVRFYFANSERAKLDAAVSMNNDRTDLRINKINGACTSNAFGANPTNIAQTSNGVLYGGEYVEFLTSSFSQFFITKSLNTLPVVFESFSATKVSNIALINWKVATTNTALTYEVLKSTDGRNFTSIATQNALAGTRNYNATDANLVNGANYYKLKATDRSGAITYSAVAVVYSNAKGFEIVSLIPTLVRGNALVSIGSDKAINATLIVTDMQGKTMLKKVIGLQAGTTDITIDAIKFAVGAYMLRAVSADGNSNVVRFIKQ